MAGALALRLVYEAVLPAAPGYRVADSFSVYSFGWEYWGSASARLWLCRGAVAELEEKEPGRLHVTVYAGEGCRCWEDALDGLPDRLGLAEDYAVFHRLAKGDPLAGCMPEALPGYRLRGAGAWMGLLVGVAQQNTGFKQGWGMLYRLHLAASQRLRGPTGWLFLEPPEPRVLRNPQVARAAGMGYRAGTVARLAALFERLGDTGCEEAVERASEIKGVGPYTRALGLLLGCRRKDVLPLDRWLKRLAAEAYSVDEAVAGDEIQRRFPGWAGLAALSATICYDAVPLRKALKRLRHRALTPGLEEPCPICIWKYTPPTM